MTEQRRRLGVGPAGTAATAATSGARLLPVELAEHADVVDAAGDNPGLSPNPGRRVLGRGGGR